MPRQPLNYQNTIIYKIVCKDLSIDYIYVGHTTSFTHRKREHKSRCNNSYPFLLYTKINENGGWDNWEMIEIEKYSCNDANEARARERYWYEELNAKLNTRCPTIDIEKDKKRAKIYLSNYNKNLTDEQKQSKREYNKEYKQQTYICDCGIEVKNGSKWKHIKTIKHLQNIKEKN
jgi:hypothetical protein